MKPTIFLRQYSSVKSFKNNKINIDNEFDMKYDGKNTNIFARNKKKAVKIVLNKKDMKKKDTPRKIHSIISNLREDNIGQGKKTQKRGKKRKMTKRRKRGKKRKMTKRRKRGKKRKKKKKTRKK